MSAVISYGIGYTGNSTAATSVVIQPPPVYASGNLLVMGVIGAGTAAAVVPSVPAGWTRLSASGASLATFYKTATGSESPYTVSLSGTAATGGFVAAFPAATIVSSSFGNSGSNVTSWTASFPGGVTSTETVLMVGAAVNTPPLNTLTGSQNLNFPSSGWATDVPVFGPVLPSNTSAWLPVGIGLAEVEGSTSNPTLTSPTGCTFYGGFVVLNVTGIPPSPLQVTATMQAPEAINGMALTVKALTGAQSPASIAARGATVSYYGGTGLPQTAITPNDTGSVIYGAVSTNFAVTAGNTYTALASTTFSQNVADSLDPAIFGTLESASTTTGGTPVTLGASAPSGTAPVLALAEILAVPGNSIAEAATATVNATMPGQYATTAAAQTAVFTTPPQPGMLLVAIVSANSYWENGFANVSISDNHRLTWTLLAEAQDPAYAGVFVAQMPGAPPLTGPVRAAHPKTFLKGHVTSSRGFTAQNPTPGPVFRQFPAVRIHPSLPRRGRTAGNAGAPVSNPAPGPVVPEHVSSLSFSTGRISWNLGSPSNNPTSGPVFRQATSPARIRPSLPPRGRVRSSPGVLPPTPGPVFRPFRFPVRTHPVLPPRGRVSFNPGTPVRNPAAGPVFRQRTSPAQARTPLPPRGRPASNPGAPVRNAAPGPVFTQKTSPARIRPHLPPRGQTGFNPGVVVRNPTAGPVFIQAVRPIAAKIPLRPRTGGATGNFTPPYIAPPVPPVPPVEWQFYGHVPVYYLDYLDWDTQATLYAVPGGSYRILIANTRAGLTIPPGDGRWILGDPVDVPLHRKVFLKLRAHIHKSRRRSGYKLGGGPG